MAFDLFVDAFQRGRSFRNPRETANVLGWATFACSGQSLLLFFLGQTEASRLSTHERNSKRLASLLALSRPLFTGTMENIVYMLVESLKPGDSGHIERDRGRGVLECPLANENRLELGKNGGHFSRISSSGLSRGTT